MGVAPGKTLRDRRNVGQVKGKKDGGKKGLFAWKQGSGAHKWAESCLRDRAAKGL